jgi:hypothetical protein
MKQNLKLLVITTPMFDYLADSILIGLRELYGENCIEFPRKAIMYGDAPSVYGRGFTIWSQPIKDIPRNKTKFEDIDLVIYTNYNRQALINWRVLVDNQTFEPRVIYLDGNDDNNVDPQLRPLYKRELYEKLDGVFPIGFGIPERLVRPINLAAKTQLHQTHVQDPEFASDIGYKFSEEKKYYDDLAKSFFGITMKKGGWDSMRHYEIMAAGTLVMFKDFNQKPPLCAPQCPHFISYTDKQDFMTKTAALLTNGRPNEAYLKTINAQRQWLLENATCTAQAQKLIRHALDYFSSRTPEKIPPVHRRKIRRAALQFFLLKEDLMFRAITFVKLNPAVDWFYYKVFRKIPGVGLFVSRILLKERPNKSL